MNPIDSLNLHRITLSKVKIMVSINIGVTRIINLWKHKICVQNITVLIYNE